MDSQNNSFQESIKTKSDSFPKTEEIIPSKLNNDTGREMDGELKDMKS